MASRLPGRIDRSGSGRGRSAEEAGAFFDEEELIGGEVLEGFEEAGGPADFEEIDLFGLSQAEVNA